MFNEFLLSFWFSNGNQYFFYYWQLSFITILEMSAFFIQNFADLFFTFSKFLTQLLWVDRNIF